MDLFYGLALKYVRWTEVIIFLISHVFKFVLYHYFMNFLIEIDIPVDQFDLYSRASSKVLKHIRGSLISDLDLGF